MGLTRSIPVLYLIIFQVTLLSCGQSDKKKIDLDCFSILVPQNWKHERQQGVDSFVGEIIGPNVRLSFDCSNMGYANHLDEIELKNHLINIDSSGKYIIKTIKPKVSGKGMTGIYIRRKSSSFNFQMNGENLSSDDQKSALTAFKTITFNK